MRPILVLALLSAATAAHAQTSDDVVVMRRAITPPRLSNAPSQQPGAWDEGDWVWDQGASTCSATAPRTRTVTCMRAGKAIDESLCAEAKPDTTGTGERTEGCGYSWHEGDWASQCSASTTRTVTCRRTDGTDVADDRCSGQKPPTTGSVTTGCSYAWNEGTYGDYSPTCSTAATRTRTVSCQAYADGGAYFPADDAKCLAVRAKPATVSDPVDYDGGCGWNWQPGAWASSCSDATTRPVACIRSDGTPAPDGKCNPASKPSASGPSYEGCGYAWVGVDGACGAEGKRNVTPVCRRSGGSSATATVADSLCAGSPAIATSRDDATCITTADYGSCTEHRFNSAYSFFPKPSGSNAKYYTVGVRTVSYGPDGNLTPASQTLVAQACATAPATAYCYAGKQTATTVGVVYTLETDMTFAGWSPSSSIAVSMKCVK